MKKIFKKLTLAIVFGLLLTTGSTFTVKAAAKPKDKSENLKQTIKTLNDSEFDSFLMKYINEDEKNGKDFEETKRELKLAGVEVERTQVDYSDEKLRYISPSQATLSSYTAKKVGDSFTRIYASIIHNVTEWSPGGLDLISVEWDSSKASYYSNNTGSFTTYMDGSQRQNGICLFNVDDYWMLAGDIAYAAVYVTPNVNGTWVDIATKYIHTYNKQNITWTVGTNVGYTPQGPTGGYSFGLTGTTITETWQLYADNAYYQR